MEMIGDQELKMAAFAVWFLGTMTVFYMGAFGRIDPASFNNVPWSQVLKSRQHQVFLCVLMAFVLMFTIRLTQ